VEKKLEADGSFREWYWESWGIRWGFERLWWGSLARSRG